MGRGAGKWRITCRFECCDKCELCLLAVEREHVHIHAHIHKAYTYICMFRGEHISWFFFGDLQRSGQGHLSQFSLSLYLSQFHLSVLVSVAAAAAANWVSAMTQFPPTDEPPLHTPQPPALLSFFLPDSLTPFLGGNKQSAKMANGFPFRLILMQAT